LSHDGLIDTSADGRKNAKKRTQAMKKQVSAAKKEAVVKVKESPAKKKKAASSSSSPAKAKKESGPTAAEKKIATKESKQLQKDLEKRRKKRSRERDKLLRSESKKKTKRRRTSPDDDDDHRVLTHDKRARATAIVNAYLSRWAKEDDSRSLALNGVMSTPVASIDSTGLLGMALAFRAAAGELAMPDDGEEQLARTKPWAAIDSDKPKNSSERTKNLEKQIELLEKEISRVRKDTEKRKLLALEYAPKRLAKEKRIEEDNLAARRNPFKKKKKIPVAKSDQSADDSPGKDESVAKDEASNVEVQAEVSATPAVQRESGNAESAAKADQPEATAQAMEIGT